MNPFRPWWSVTEWTPFYGEQLAKDVAKECLDDGPDVKRIKWAARWACRRLRVSLDAALDSNRELGRQVIELTDRLDQANKQVLASEANAYGYRETAKRLREERDDARQVLRKLKSAIIDCRADGSVPNQACLTVIDEVLGEG